MDNVSAPETMLDLLNYPGFAVKDGKIAYVNEAAKNRFFETGTDISGLLLTGQEEYAEFTDGALYLSLGVAGSTYDATVIAACDMHLFLIEHAPSHSELQALALVSQQLRMPLADILAASDQLFNEDFERSDAQKEKINQINRGIYQLLRLIGNMSDAGRCLDNPKTELYVQNISAIVEEVMEKSAALLNEMQITLRFRSTEQPVIAPADKERLERALYNLVSNAVKFSPKNAVLNASLTLKKNLLCFTLANPGEGVAKEVRGNMFNRFLRAPGFDDHRFGAGLGMVIVYAAAATHGGTVLVENPPDGGTKVTLTLKLRHNQEPVVRHTPFPVDYAGGHDHGLLELSDVLPDSAFNKYL